MMKLTDEHKDKLIILIALLIIISLPSLIGCSARVITRPVIIPIPQRPETPQINFSNRASGVWLSYEQARKLARYRILLESYIKKLKIRILENNRLARGEGERD